MTQLSAPTSSKSPADDLYLNSEHPSPQAPVFPTPSVGGDQQDLAASLQNLSVTGSPNVNAYAPPPGPPPSQAHVETPPSYDTLGINQPTPTHPTDEKRGSEWVDEKEQVPRDAPFGAGPPPPPQSQEFYPMSSQPPPTYLPQPPSFSRPVPPYLPYMPFAPMTIYANGRHLSSGFPTTLPLAVSPEAHPFATHDIQELDWVSFLGSLKEAGTLKGGEKFVGSALVLGIAGGLTFGIAGGVTGVIVGKAMHYRMMKKKCLAVGELINIWNQVFFHPRKMEVVLAKGPERLSGPGGQGLPPDWDVESRKVGGGCGHSRTASTLSAEGSNLRRTSTGSSTASSSSSSSSSSSDVDPGTRATLKAEKKAMRAEHKETKRALKHQHKALKHAIKAQGPISSIDEEQMKKQAKAESKEIKEALKVQCKESRELRKAEERVRKEARREEKGKRKEERRRGRKFRLVVVSIA
ncbi:hypothetical protein JAAARDRAFT_191439 [Jaapia argillacea MUCL 33604]|uniref:Uncharacterized protein n=1 Tax=Jaapia argillacea MUCL 33604 TaxID=933084 RepID=A0A067PZ88_9AGAM|nr:hypothetical protein JAAARDRAFT_191439 [Jaapia argillacea MUCL 33604]